MNRYRALAAVLVAAGLAFFGLCALAAFGDAGPMAATAAPSTEPVRAAELIEAAPIGCQAEQLADAQAALPYDTGVQWVWADLTDAWGITFVEARVVALSVDVPCPYVAAVAIHEWAHAAGSLDETPYRGEERGEVVADCAVTQLVARVPGRNVAYRHYADPIGGCTDQLNADAARLIAGR